MGCRVVWLNRLPVSHIPKTTCLAHGFLRLAISDAGDPHSRQDDRPTVAPPRVPLERLYKRCKVRTEGQFSHRRHLSIQQILPDD